MFCTICWYVAVKQYRYLLTDCRSVILVYHIHYVTPQSGNQVSTSLGNSGLC